MTFLHAAFTAHHPSRVAALRGWTNGLLSGLCAAVSPAGPVLPHRQPAVLLGRLAGVLLSRASPGSRKRLSVAAAFFFLLRKRNVIPAGPRQGQASLRSVRTRTLDMTLSARIEEAREGGRKTQMPQQPAAFAARGRTACFTPRRHGKIWRSGGSTGTRRCTAAAHSPQKNPLEEDC